MHEEQSAEDSRIPCPVPGCSREFRSRSGYTKHKRTQHPGWRGPDLEDADCDSPDAAVADDELEHGDPQDAQTHDAAEPSASARAETEYTRSASSEQCTSGLADFRSNSEVHGHGDLDVANGSPDRSGSESSDTSSDDRPDPPWSSSDPDDDSAVTESDGEDYADMPLLSDLLDLSDEDDDDDDMAEENNNNDEDSGDEEEDEEDEDEEDEEDEDEGEEDEGEEDEEDEGDEEGEEDTANEHNAENEDGGFQMGAADVGDDDDDAVGRPRIGSRAVISTDNGPNLIRRFFYRHSARFGRGALGDQANNRAKYGATRSSSHSYRYSPNLAH
ncbi:hypothetical protein OH77DRAFT_1509482 [Trametes cingulata]|nr:hypothetical protein OH77DRAFT_1509482 [Trametes cingulata]